MRLVPCLRLVSVMLAALAAGSAWAQPYGYPPQQRGYYASPPPQQRARDPRAYPPGYYPGKLIQQAPQQGFSLRRLFGIPPDPTPYQQAPIARPARPKPAPKPVVARQEQTKPNAATQIVVFGDSLADYASRGIDEAYAESEDVAIVRKSRGESGLVRSNPDEWPKFIRDTLDGGQKVTLAVVMLGVNDRSPIKEGNDSFEPLTDRWRDIYRQRVEAVARLFKERNIPFVWIGLPPMRSDKLSDDLIAMNDIFRDGAHRFGGEYVDIWPGFVDEENRYTMTGPDVEGQTAKLRTNDGVLFTSAGARKVAHFADVAIKTILDSGASGAVNAIKPGEPVPEGASLEASLPMPPEPADLPVLPSKPLIGPVLPLTRPDLAQGGTLISTPPRLTGDRAYPIQRSLREGAPSNPPPGRADDFRWPPS